MILGGALETSAANTVVIAQGMVDINHLFYIATPSM